VLKLIPAMATAPFSKDAEALEFFLRVTNSDELTARHLLEAAEGDAHAAVELFFSTVEEHRSPSDCQLQHAVLASTSCAVQRTTMPIDGKFLSQMGSKQSSSGHARQVEAFRRSDVSARSTANRNDLASSSEGGSRAGGVFDLFLPPIAMCHDADFENTLKYCRKSSLWLLLHVQHSEDFASYQMNRDLWSNETVHSVISASFCFWIDIKPRNTKTAEYFTLPLGPGKLRPKLVVDKIPYVAIVDPFSLGIAWKYTKEGLGPELLIENMLKFLDSSPVQKHENLGNDATKKRSGGGISSISSDSSCCEVEEFIVHFRFPSGLKISHKFPSSALVEELYQFARGTKVSSKELSLGKEVKLKYICQCIHELGDVRLTLEEAGVKK